MNEGPSTAAPPAPSFRNEPGRAVGPDDGMEVRRLIGAIWARRWVIIFCGLIGGIIAYGLIAQVTPRYLARASVMLDPRNLQVLTADDVVTDVTLNNPFLDTEAAVLRSNMLAEKVIASFPPERLTAIDPASRAPTLRDRLGGLVGNGAMATPPDPSTPQGAARQLRRLTTALRQSMRVWREGQSYLINVSVETTDAELSMLLTNAIVAQYIDDLADQRSETVRSATVFLTERVESLRGQVEAAEAKVVDYRIRQLAESGLSLQTIEQQEVDLGTQFVLARSDLATAEARYRQIDNVIQADGFNAAADLLSSPLVLALREELSSLQRQEADLATALGPDHPDRQRLRASMGRITDELASEVRKIVAALRGEVDVAQIRVDTIQESLSETESRAAAMARSSLGLNQLEREAEALRVNYQAMLSRLSETRSIEELQRAEARVVERAVTPGAPSAPRVLLFTALGISGGLSFGLILAFLLTISGRGFTSPGQIEAATGIPVLVALPLGRWRDRATMIRSLARLPYQPFAERLRQLRASLMFSAGREASKVVLITSSVPGEGKTTVAVGLAYAEGLAKRSCVLLDFDLRRSPLAREMGYAPAKGDLADLLAGTCTLDEALGGNAELGFDLLTVRAPRPDLVDEIQPEAVTALIKALGARYSTVVIDSTPVLAVADALMLVREADETLLLVKAASTGRQAVVSSARQLEEAGAHAMGIGLTMTDPRFEDSSYGGTYPAA